MVIHINHRRRDSRMPCAGSTLSHQALQIFNLATLLMSSSGTGVHPSRIALHAPWVAEAMPQARPVSRKTTISINWAIDMGGPYTPFICLN